MDTELHHLYEEKIFKSYRVIEQKNWKCDWVRK